MKYFTDLLYDRIHTAIFSVPRPEQNGSPTIPGFIDAKDPEDSCRQQTLRVLKHFSREFEEKPIATFLEPGRLGSIKFACLLTRTHLYASHIKDPILLTDIWDVDWNMAGNTLLPSVSAGAYRYSFLCPGQSANYLHDVLKAVYRALRLTRGAEAVFAAAMAARRDKTPLPEEPLSLIESTLDAERLFANARVCLVGNRDVEQGLSSLVAAADLGSADAQYALALFFRQNAAPKQRDDASAAYWFAQAADQGHEAAALQLSVYGEATRKQGRDKWMLQRLFSQSMDAPQENIPACLDHASDCLAEALVLTDWGLNPNADKANHCLRAFESLKEARAWLEYARLLGSHEADERLNDLARTCRSTIVNDVIPALQELHREEDAFLCRLWLAELGDVPCRANVARHYLEDKGLHREPFAGLQWLEWAFEGHSVHAPGICAELGAAYVTGAHLSPARWRHPLPPTPRDRAIGFYLLERGRCEDALKRHLPTAPEELAALAAELDAFPFPLAAELAEQYRAMAADAAGP